MKKISQTIMKTCKVYLKLTKSRNTRLNEFLRGIILALVKLGEPNILGMPLGGVGPFASLLRNDFDTQDLDGVRSPVSFTARSQHSSLQCSFSFANV